MELGLRKHSKRIALEMIDIQDASFGAQLETLVGEIKQKIDDKTFSNYDNLMGSSYPKELEAMIFKRTGLRIQLIVNEDVAAILSFFANKNHIFIDPKWRGNFSIKDQQLILNNAQNKKGTVDLQKARVGGLFSEYNNQLYINFHVVFSHYRLSVREVVAVILHELGHAFYNCEFSNRLESTNQILANVAKELMSDKPEKNLEYIYKELKSLDDEVSEKDVDDIVNGNRTIAGFRLFKVLLNSVDSQLSDPTYDKTAFEQLADHFATRFGYGRDLITGLDKLHDYFANPEKSQAYNTFNTILTAMAFMLTSFMLLHTILFLPGSIIMMVEYGLSVKGILHYLQLFFFFFAIFSRNGEDDLDYTYDKLKIRYKRIRNMYIDAIKKSNVSKDELKAIIDNIYYIDGIISNTYIKVDVFNKFTNLVFSKSKKADRHIREQQLLEDLAHNDLFLKAAELSTLK